MQKQLDPLIDTVVPVVFTVILFAAGGSMLTIW